MISAQNALQRLKDGNRRFISGEGGRDLDVEHVRRQALVQGQAPFAIVLGCSDSRVPLELVFDQGIGDLFVVRVAGNVAGPTQLGSMEFAAETFETPLLVVMGHSSCGAVAATVDGVLSSVESLSPNLDEVAVRIQPAVHGLLDQAPQLSRDALIDQAVEAHVRNTVAGLRRDSGLLERRIQAGRLAVVGAVYSLDSGAVRFLDESR